MSPLDSRPRLSEGPVRMSPEGAMGAVLRLSRLSLRCQLEAECAKAGKRTADKSTLERLTLGVSVIDQHGAPPMRVPKPSGGWVKVPIAVAAAIAESRLPEDEKAKYAHFKAEVPKLQKAARGERGRRMVDREIERRRAVFLRRFFPVPEPDEWQPGFWSPREHALIESTIINKLKAIENPVEPLWWPDGWKEAMER